MYTYIFWEIYLDVIKNCYIYYYYTEKYNFDLNKNIANTKC